MPAQGICNYYKYVVLLDRALDRQAYKQKLKNGFGVCLTGEVYEVPIHQQPVFQHVSQYPLPVADDVCARHLCLPILASMTIDQALQVVDALKSTL